jgi:tetratricopeptide (TPR) repeat protein
LFSGGSIIRNLDWQDSVRLWKSALGTTHDSTRIYNNLALEYIKRKEYDKAETELKKALIIKPDYRYALASLGYIYFKKGDYDRALEYYRDSQKKKPIPISFYITGNIFEIKGEPDRAIEEYRRAVAMDFEIDMAHLRLAMLYDKKGDIERAQRQYEDFNMLNGNVAQAHYNLGIIYGKKGYIKAIDEFKKAIQLDPDYGEAHYNLAITYLALDPPDIEHAREHLRKAKACGFEFDTEAIKGILKEVSRGR